MELIADMFLIAAAAAATFYCVVLSRRLKRFTDLEKGVGGAIAALSSQVEDMTRALRTAQSSATESTASLADLTRKADASARRLELLVAAMHDLPPAPEPARPAPEEAAAAAPAPEAAEAPALFLSKRQRVAEEAP